MIICKNCGNQLPDGENFCSECGESLHDESTDMNGIIISAKNGDPEAFGKLYESCRKAGISLAKQYVKNDTDAEDMYQDAFLKAMENIDRFDENRQFGPWLNTIIANTCKDFLGKKRPMNFTDMSDEENEFVDTIASTDESSLPESMYVRKEMLQIVDGIVEMLPDEQKEATLLFYYKDYSVKQVAEYQHVSEDTVKSRLNYSRKKVEQATKDYEKKHGIKICAYSVIPAILVLYFKNNVYASQLDASLGALSASNAMSAAGAGAKTVTGAVKAGAAVKTAAAAGKVAAWKIVAAAVAGIIATAGVGFAIHHFVTSGDRDETVAEYSKDLTEESEDLTENDNQVADAQEEPSAEELARADGYINDEGYYVFGSYEQDGDLSNGSEPIEWEILDDSDGKLLLISRYILDARDYNTQTGNVTWETCELRNWLNNDFYNIAFSSEEQRHILTATLSNPDNPINGTEGGNDTQDKVFCLSMEEILKYYTFEEWNDEKQCGRCSALMTVVSDYAQSKTYGYWWLRSPGLREFNVCFVSPEGEVGYGLYHSEQVGFHELGVRPALYISESISLDSENQTGNSIQEESVAEAEGFADDNKRADGFINDEGYYVFGLYEQDGDLSNGPEPIEWEILDKNENGTLLVSRYVLDRVHYHNYPSDCTWETCLLRSWLNDNFYNAAFDDEMKACINTVTVVNEDNPFYGTPGGNDTSDKIFVLSISEIERYYCPDLPLIGYIESLVTMPTPYAESRGVSRHTFTENDLKDGPDYFADLVGKTGATWWLRTPSYNSDAQCYVSADGWWNAGADNSKDEDFGVRPALYINN